MPEPDIRELIDHLRRADRERTSAIRGTREYEDATRTVEKIARRIWSAPPDHIRKDLREGA